MTEENKPMDWAEACALVEGAVKFRQWYMLMCKGGGAGDVSVVDRDVERLSTAFSRLRDG